ncbi:MAG: hypothetical protein JXR53_02915 [Bacteroidales bacterium]|nr:hypothetical protein [Bacteroidales bacterium]
MTLTTGQIENLRRAKAQEIHIADLSICYHCKSTGLKEEDYFCPNCRFPQRGTQQEMKIFMNRMRIKKMKHAEKKSAVKRGRIVLYLLAGFNLLVGIIMWLITDDISILIGSIIGAGIYFALAEWSKKKPFPAILIGFFVYIVFMLINAIIDPNTLYQGLIIKIVIILGFVYGFKGAKEAENLEKELNELNNAVDLEENNDLQQLST